MVCDILETRTHQVLTIDCAEFLGIKPSASQDDINKAYRKKSRTLHPDKVKQNFIASKSLPPKTKAGEKKKKPGVHVSKGPSQKEINKAVKEASERFARLGLVTNILRGGERDRYDHFLSNGFPAWRGTGYYYSRYRPGLGTVLLGLFLAFGGAAHYGALYLGWKRQRDFVDRYIRHARRAAWGDEMGIRGIPGLSSTSGVATPPPPPPPAADPSVPQPRNRREKRFMDKEKRKEMKSGKSGRSSGTATPTQAAAEPVAPTGEKKRVVAENGKVLIVDSVGNVFLEEETEDGERAEFLLDVDEIPKPTWRDTAVYRLPVFVFSFAKSKVTGKKSDAADDGEEEFLIQVDGGDALNAAAADEAAASAGDESGFEFVESGVAQSSANGAEKVRRRGKKGGKR